MRTMPAGIPIRWRTTGSRREKKTRTPRTGRPLFGGGDFFRRDQQHAEGTAHDCQQARNYEPEWPLRANDFSAALSFSTGMNIKRRSASPAACRPGAMPSTSPLRRPRSQRTRDDYADHARDLVCLVRKQGAGGMTSSLGSGTTELSMAIRRATPNNPICRVSAGTTQ